MALLYRLHHSCLVCDQGSMSRLFDDDGERVSSPVPTNYSVSPPPGRLTWSASSATQQRPSIVVESEMPPPSSTLRGRPVSRRPFFFVFLCQYFFFLSMLILSCVDLADEPLEFERMEWEPPPLNEWVAGPALVVWITLNQGRSFSLFFSPSLSLWLSCCASHPQPC